MIPPLQNGDFVARMETVLDIYKLLYDPLFPVVCMDESPKQLIAEAKVPVPAKPGTLVRYDYEYCRKGVCNVFIATEPLMGKRKVKIMSCWKKQDWAKFLNEIARSYRHAEKITLMIDNLNAHKPGSLYETFKPEKTRSLLKRFEFYTPKHGNWLNMAEVELRVLSNQFLNRRIDSIAEMHRQVDTWENERNNKEAVINWRFTTDDAWIKLKKLYPSVSS